VDDLFEQGVVEILEHQMTDVWAFLRAKLAKQRSTCVSRGTESATTDCAIWSWGRRLNPETTTMKYVAILHKDRTSDFSVSFPDFFRVASLLPRPWNKQKRAPRPRCAGCVSRTRETGEELSQPSSFEAVMSNPNFADGPAILVATD
jgi:hypothetical protein